MLIPCGLDDPSDQFDSVVWYHSWILNLFLTLACIDFTCYDIIDKSARQENVAIMLKFQSVVMTDDSSLLHPNT